MALCPFATHRLIPPGSSDPRIQPRVAILHVDAGNQPSLYDYFKGRSGGIESHFHVRLDGTIEQYRDTAWQADANNLANDFAVSIETQGYGDGQWTPAQLASIKQLLRWLHEVHPAIRLAKVDRWDGAGIGHHTQFGAPGPWTPVAKSCPGPRRIQQFHDVLVPWLNTGAPTTTEDDMPTPEETRAIVREEIAKAVPDIAAAAAKAVLASPVISAFVVAVQSDDAVIAPSNAHTQTVVDRSGRARKGQRGVCGPDVLVDPFGREVAVSVLDGGEDGAVVGAQLIGDPLPIRPERMQRMQDGASHGVA